MAAIFWSKVTVAFQSALAAADTITAITNANPGVATATAHGMANGDYVYLLVNGMPSLNNRVVRIANVTTNTFELQGVDTTSLGTFSSGTAEAVTFGNTMSTAKGVNASGGDPEFADITTIHDNIRKQVPVVTSPLTMSFDSIFDPADAALVALKTAADALAIRAVKLTFSSGAIITFAGYVSCSLTPTGNAQEVVSTSVTLTAAARPTVYAS